MSYYPSAVRQIGGSYSPFGAVTSTFDYRGRAKALAAADPGRNLVVTMGIDGKDASVIVAAEKDEAADAYSIATETPKFAYVALFRKDDPFLDDPNDPVDEALMVGVSQSTRFFTEWKWPILIGAAGLVVGAALFYKGKAPRRRRRPGRKMRVVPRKRRRPSWRRRTITTWF
jgi:hypothetical protein